MFLFLPFLVSLLCLVLFLFILTFLLNQLFTAVSAVVCSRFVPFRHAAFYVFIFAVSGFFGVLGFVSFCLR
jgi:hypothetical protein